VEVKLGKSIILLLILLSGCSHDASPEREATQGEQLSHNSAEFTRADARRTDEFCFGPVGVGASISSGEKLFSKIAKSEKPLENFLKLHAWGNHTAQTYAMVGFYYLDRPLYELFKKQCEKLSVVIPISSGCWRSRATQQRIFGSIEEGYYLRYIPEEMLAEAEINANSPAAALLTDSKMDLLAGWLAHHHD
jgi:hypothetical protein